jgi:predicted CXXCH cytochrome family protein
MLKSDAKALCVSCHKTSADPWRNHINGKKACLDCHAGHSTEPSFLKREPTELCLSCHKEPKKPARHPFGVEMASGGKIGCTSCHQVHGVARKESFGVACAKCHVESRERKGKIHLEKIRPKSAHPWGANEQVCLECHDPHAKKTSTLALCTSCHVTREHTHRQSITISGTARAHGVTLEGDQISCKTCHQVHGGSFRDPAKVKPFCSSCHGADAERLYSGFHRLGKKHR